MSNKSSKKHPLEQPLSELYKQLTVLNGSLILLDNQLNNYRASINRKKDEYRGPNLLLFGTTLILRDLVKTQNQKFIDLYRAGLFTKRGDEYFNASDELVARWAAWTVSQCYEFFETYLKDINSCYFQKRKPNQSMGQLKYLPIGPNKIVAWKTLFREKQWNSQSLLELIRIIAPQLKKHEKDNALNVNMVQWHTLFRNARDAIVHSNMIIKPERTDALKDIPVEYIEHYFPMKQLEESYILEISKQNAKETIQLTGAYAILIFRCLSEVGGFDLKVLQPLSQLNK